MIGKFRSHFSVPVVALMAVSVVGAAGDSLAQEGPVLDEIIVTATKREVGLQDVPIAVSVVSGQKIQEQGITKLEDLAPLLPNVHIGDSGGDQRLFIRGIGTGINVGFEQSVGTFIDGVYFGRGHNARAAFMDLERVEVLKGPQSALFGKNTIAGVINITTAQPTVEFTGYIEAAYEDVTDGIGATVVLSGPLSDTIRARLAVKKWDDDGWVKNTFVATDGPGDDVTVGRLTLEWDASENFTFNLKAEYGQFDVIGRNDMISIATPEITALYRDFGDPDFEAAFNFSQSDANIVTPDGRSGELDTMTSEIYQLTAVYSWDALALRSITAYTAVDLDLYRDIDGGPILFLATGAGEDHEQFTQEFLLTSDLGGPFEYLAGVHYRSAKRVKDNFFHVQFSSLPPIESIIYGAVGLPAGTPPGFLDASPISHFEQETQSASAFAELTWHVSDAFRIILGGRYSTDDKEMFLNNFVAAIFDDMPDAFLGAVYGINGLRFGETFTFDANTPGFDNTRREDDFTGNINFAWDVTEGTLVYLNIANGFKSGGWNALNSLGTVQDAEFEDEGVKSYELGAKLGFWDGRGRLNIAAFLGDYEDLQVSTFDGNCCFIVGNAAKAEVSGIEGDFALALTDAFTVTGAFSFLDAKYISFPGAACNAFQKDDGSCLANGGVQDLSGKSLQFAPDFAASLSADYVTPIADNLKLRLSAEVNFTDDYFVTQSHDPNMIQSSFSKINARVQLGDVDGRWMFALVGRNLTDEKTFTHGGDLALSSLGFNFSYFHHIDPPRTFELQARYGF